MSHNIFIEICKIRVQLQVSVWHYTEDFGCNCIVDGLGSILSKYALTSYIYYNENGLITTLTSLLQRLRPI